MPSRIPFPQLQTFPGRIISVGPSITDRELTLIEQEAAQLIEGMRNETSGGGSTGSSPIVTPTVPSPPAQVRPSTNQLLDSTPYAEMWAAPDPPTPPSSITGPRDPLGGKTSFDEVGIPQPAQLVTFSLSQSATGKVIKTGVGLAVTAVGGAPAGLLYTGLSTMVTEGSKGKTGAAVYDAAAVAMAVSVVGGKVGSVAGTGGKVIVKETIKNECKAVRREAASKGSVERLRPKA